MFIKIYPYKNHKPNLAATHKITVNEGEEYDIRVNDRLVWTSRKLTYSQIIETLTQNFEIYNVGIKVLNDKEILFFKEDKELTVGVGEANSFPPLGAISWYNIVFNTLVEKLELPINQKEIQK